MELFKILGKLVVDTADGIKQLTNASSAAKQTANDLEDTGQSGEKSGGKLSSAFKKIGSGVVAVGKVAVTGLAAGAGALGALTGKALSAAGELEQNMGGSEAVFKEHAGKMQETARSAFEDMGLSTSDFLATANKMGALFQGAGFDIETSATMSSEAMQRAADVASIMGIDTSAAMEAIAGAAKGNFTMMDNLGVAMNDTTLQAYALSKGIEKSTQDMTNQEKIGLAMEMFMEKTAYAASNYAKENDTLAGSLGTAKAALSNFLSGAGTVEDVVSAFSNAGHVIVKNIKDIFPSLMTGITQLVNQLVPMIPPLLEQVLPGLIEGATSLINGLVAAAPQIVQALLAALPALLDGLMQIMNALISAFPSLIEMICQALPSLIPALVNGLVSMIVLLCQVLPQIIQPIIDNLPLIISSLCTALIDNLPALIQGVIQLVFGLVAALPAILQAVWDAIVIAFQSLPEMFGGIFDSIVNVIASVFPGAKDYIIAVWEAIKNYISTVVNAIKNVITTVWNNIKNNISTVINAVKNVISTVWNAIKTIIANVMNIIFSVIKGDWESVRSSISNILNAIKSVISSVWNGIKSVISSVVNGIKNTISSVFNGIKSVATAAWNGIKTAMTKPIESARDKIKGIIDKVKGFFTGMKLQFPNIKLPHFSIKPSGWKIGDLLQGSIPKLGIDWYAKAMQNPMIMTKPTIFGYDAANGKLMGGGEAGSEVVTGTGTLMSMIQNAVAAQNSGIVYYLQKIIELLAQFFPNILDAMAAEKGITPDELARMLANPMNRELGKLAVQKGRGR